MCKREHERRVLGSQIAVPDWVESDRASFSALWDFPQEYWVVTYEHGGDVFFEACDTAGFYAAGANGKEVIQEMFDDARRTHDLVTACGGNYTFDCTEGFGDCVGCDLASYCPRLGNPVCFTDRS